VNSGKLYNKHNQRFQRINIFSIDMSEIFTTTDAGRWRFSIFYVRLNSSQPGTDNRSSLPTLSPDFYQKTS